MSGLMNVNKNRTIIIVGKEREEKLKKAHAFVSDSPIIQYANEYNIEDNYSIPIDIGIIIEEVDYKPNIDLIKKTILQYKGQVVLLSSNQKSVPKSLFNMCSLKRALKNNTEDYIKNIAPHSDDRINYELDIFPMMRNYLINSNREEVATLLKLNKTPDIQLISWIAPNLHPNRIAFVDFVVKRKWSSNYFYELLAFSHDGKIHRKMKTPKRGSYLKTPRIMRKLGLKERDMYLFNNLKQNVELKNSFKNKLSHEECRLLHLGEKKRRRKLEPIVIQPELKRWL